MRKFWKWVDGKKTVIAALSGVALAWAQSQGYMDESTATALALGLTLVTGVAVGHKVIKANVKPE